MRHLDLFSGIGGFALAAERVWDEIEHVFCDNEPFAQAVLKKHWPKAKIYGDIRTLTADAERQRQPQSKGSEQKKRERTRNVDILTGGFPCQPASQAGLRKGAGDARWLWPEMLRVVREFSPRWVVGENVRGLLSLGGGLEFEKICLDLEDLGYEVQPFVIPAVAVGAPHRRDRVWIVAHSNTDAGGIRRHKRASIEKRTASRGSSQRASSDTEDSERWAGQYGEQDSSVGTPRNDKLARSDWSESWIEVATRLCPLDDGLPNGSPRPRGWRNAALKGAGNAIVPAVAEQIFRAIKQYDERP